MPHETEIQIGPTWQSVAYGTGTLVLAFGGYFIGDTLTVLRHEIRELRQEVRAYAVLESRLSAVEREHAESRETIRKLEEESWKHNHRP